MLYTPELFSSAMWRMKCTLHEWSGSDHCAQVALTHPASSCWRWDRGLLFFDFIWQFPQETACITQLATQQRPVAGTFVRIQAT